MIRKITINDLNWLVQVMLKESPMKNVQQLKDKISTFIHDNNTDGLIIDEVGFILYSIDNKHHTYLHPTIYHELPNHYFEPDGQLIAIHQLWIEKKHRRRGHGTHLKKALENEARLRNIFTIYTHTSVSNDSIIKLNQKLDYDILRIGFIEDDILKVSMIKKLNNKTPFELLKNVKNNNCLIEAQTLYNHMNEYQILDIRLLEDSKDNKIFESIRCHWYDVHGLVSSNKLTFEKPIAVICYTGQSSMHVASLLNALGYNAFSLLDGMEKWPYK